MPSGGEYGFLTAGILVTIFGTLLVVALLVHLPQEGASTAVTLWVLASATGGSLLFLGVLLVTQAVRFPGAANGPEVHRDLLITAASILFYFSGFASVASFLPTLLYINGTGNLPEAGGIRFYGDALFERLWGVRGILVSLVPFAVLGAFEILAGTWLWRSSQIGGALGLWLTPFAVVFLVGYGAPYIYVDVPLRVLLVVLAWSSLT